MDATGVDPLRQVYDGERRVELRRRPVGDLQLRRAAVLRLQQPGGDQSDQVAEAVAVSGRLPELLLRPDGRVLGRAGDKAAEFQRDCAPIEDLETV